MRMQLTLLSKLTVEPKTLARILGSERAAAEQVALIESLKIPRQAPPQQKQDLSIAVFQRNASSAHFDRLAEHLIREILETELTRGIEGAYRPRHLQGLHTVGADHCRRRPIFHQQVVADVVETVFITLGRKRDIQSLAQLQVEDSEAKMLDLIELVSAAYEAQPIAPLLELHARGWEQGGNSLSYDFGHDYAFSESIRLQSDVVKLRLEDA